MAKLLKLRRGTTTQHGSFTGAEGEVTIDTTKDTAVVHDGSQAGGRPLAREDMTNVSSASIAGRLSNDSIAVSKIAAGTLPSDVKIQDANVSGNLTIATADINNDAVTQAKIADDSVGGAQLVNGSVTSTKIGSGAVTSDKIADGAIVNADVNASAAIAGTKISPDFGSQNITTTGVLNCDNINASDNITITSTAPILSFNEGDGDPDYRITVDAGKFRVQDTTNGNATRFQINTDGHLDVFGNADFLSGIDVTGNITVSGTVDGRDVASDGSKLDGIESGATADQTAAEIRTLVESASDSNVFTDADHSKLNGIEASATADQTASEILTLIKTVDGSGSGLDADTIDGISSGSFLRSDTADTATGDITFSGGGGAVTIAAASDIRGTTGNWTGEAAGKIQWHSNHMYFQTNSNWIFRSQNGTERAYLDSSGNFVATGNVTAYSDARLKTDIHTINDALGICGKLRGVSYKWLENGKAGIGVIAQEVEEILPEVVLNNVNTDPATGKTTEVKSVDYGKIVGVLINAINELKEEVEELKNAKITG